MKEADTPQQASPEHTEVDVLQEDLSDIPEEESATAPATDSTESSIEADTVKASRRLARRRAFLGALAAITSVLVLAMNGRKYLHPVELANGKLDGSSKETPPCDSCYVGLAVLVFSPEIFTLETPRSAQEPPEVPQNELAKALEQREMEPTTFPVVPKGMPPAKAGVPEKKFAKTLQQPEDEPTGPPGVPVPVRIPELHMGDPSAPAVSHVFDAQAYDYWCPKNADLSTKKQKQRNGRQNSRVEALKLHDHVNQSLPCRDESNMLTWLHT
ncbi:hypothetical protein ACSSS7_002295 [Eimeria intestinalis]